jgi:hypothetical protein
VMQSAGEHREIRFQHRDTESREEEERKERGASLGLVRVLWVITGRLDPNPARSCANRSPTPPHTSPRERHRVARERLRVDQKSLRMAREQLCMAWGLHIIRDRRSLCHQSRRD